MRAIRASPAAASPEALSSERLTTGFFAPYSAFTVKRAEWRAGTVADPHQIDILAAVDNQGRGPADGTVVMTDDAFERMKSFLYNFAVQYPVRTVLLYTVHTVQLYVDLF